MAEEEEAIVGDSVIGERVPLVLWRANNCVSRIEELKALNDQRKILLPDNMPPSPPLDPAKANGDVKMSDAEDLPANMSDEVPDSEDDAQGKKPRRSNNDRAAERKRKADSKEQQERKEKAEAAARAPKPSKQFQKVLKDIQKKEDEIAECEREIAVIDNDLREADCPRTRVLGKDRFWNRYYWFERNGMPYGGLPDSSTASAGYANGCIWVQGPDELERVGYVDMEPEYQDEYKAKFDMTVPERKRREEGATSVFNAFQWGYYADPDDVDALIAWLDPRGFNELKLRKELVNYRDKIVKNMENRKAYLTPPGDNKKEAEGGEGESNNHHTPPAASAGKRMSTRGSRSAAAAAAAAEPPPFRCMNWRNTMALEEIGHLHSQQPPPARSRRPTKKKEAAAAAEAEAVVTRGKKGRQSTGGGGR